MLTFRPQSVLSLSLAAALFADEAVFTQIVGATGGPDAVHRYGIRKGVRGKLSLGKGKT